MNFLFNSSVMLLLCILLFIIQNNNVNGVIVRSSSSKHKRQRVYNNYIIRRNKIQEEYKIICDGQYPIDIPLNTLQCEDISNFNLQYIKNNKQKDALTIIFMFLVLFVIFTLTICNSAVYL